MYGHGGNLQPFEQTLFPLFMKFRLTGPVVSEMFEIFDRGLDIGVIGIILAHP